MSGTSCCLALRELRHDDERLAGMFLPRTRTHVFLQGLGLPVLDGCLVLVDDDAGLREAASIMSAYGDRAIVRSDPLRSDAPTIRGGDVWALSDLKAAATKYLSLGRALILLEPYERTANEWSFSLLGGLPDHAFVLEVVGAGFDTGDLNRGRLTPHESYTGDLLGPAPRITSRHPFDRSRYRQDLAARGDLRDANVAEPLPEPLLSEILRHFARVEPTRREMFALSGAVLQPGRRLVFWDLYDPAQGNR